MDLPYTPPSLPLRAPIMDTAGLIRSKRFHGRAAVICGLGVVIPPMLGLIGTVIGMVGAFGELSKSGSADPSALAGDISFALLTTLWGLVFSVISLIPFIVFLVLFLKKRRALREIADH